MNQHLGALEFSFSLQASKVNAMKENLNVNKSSMAFISRSQFSPLLRSLWVGEN